MLYQPAAYRRLGLRVAKISVPSVVMNCSQARKFRRWTRVHDARARLVLPLRTHCQLILSAAPALGAAPGDLDSPPLLGHVIENFEPLERRRMSCRRAAFRQGRRSHRPPWPSNQLAAHTSGREARASRLLPFAPSPERAAVSTSIDADPSPTRRRHSSRPPRWVAGWREHPPRLAVLVQIISSLVTCTSYW